MRSMILVKQGSTVRGNRRRGGAVLEMALTVAMLCWLSFGMVEFGCYFWFKNTMQNAAREGCRAGIVAGAADSDVSAAVLNQLKVGGLLPSSAVSTGNFTVTVNPTTFGGTTSGGTTTATSVGSTLTVQVTALWGTVGSSYRPMAMIGSTKKIVASTAMRKEG